MDAVGKESQEMSVSTVGCYICKSLVSSESAISMNTELSYSDLRLKNISRLWKLEIVGIFKNRYLYIYLYYERELQWGVEKLTF